MTKEQKIMGLLELAKQLGNVSQACKMLGYSRDSFYRFKELYDKGGDLALAEMSHRKPILANRTPPEIEAQGHRSGFKAVGITHPLKPMPKPVPTQHFARRQGARPSFSSSSRL